MDKKEIKTEVILGFSVEGVRSAVKNAKRVEEVVLDVPCVDPRSLHIDDTIYGLKIVPVDDSVKSPVPSTLCTVGVVETNIETLSGRVNPGMITINGTIDIPKEMGRTNSVEDVYFEEKDAARAVAMAILEEQWVKSEEALDKAKEVRDFLKEQFEAARV